MDRDQQEAFKEAVERKKEASEERSRAQRPMGGRPGDAAGVTEDPQASLIEDGRTQDKLSPRDKNAGKGKKTADKWNQ